MGFVPKILESNNDDKTLKFVWNPVLKINALSVFLSFAIMSSKDSNSSLLPDKSLEPVEPIPYGSLNILLNYAANFRSTLL